jgi:hypothetical protein
MIVATAMTVLCIAAIAFYVRFLIALCKERRSHRILFVGRLHRGSVEFQIPEARKLRTSLRRVA